MYVQHGFGFAHGWNSANAETLTIGFWKVGTFMFGRIYADHESGFWILREHCNFGGQI